MQVVLDIINRREDPRSVDYYVVGRPDSQRRKIRYPELRQIINKS